MKFYSLFELNPISNDNISVSYVFLFVQWKNRTISMVVFQQSYRSSYYSYLVLLKITSCNLQRSFWLKCYIYVEINLLND